MDRVPVIDISSASAVSRVREACEAIGFLIVAGHGLPEGLLPRAFAESLAFFQADDEVKRAAAPPVPRLQRGYHGLATRNLGKTLGLDLPPDLRESFFLGPIDDHRARFPNAGDSYALNVLPEKPAGFTETMVALYRGFEELSDRLLRVFALALGLREDWFADKTRRHFSVMSSHHYPPLREPPLPGQLRTGPHTDFGAMTILAMTGGQGGLEVRMPSGDWSPVTAGSDELVINLGDMMARWTNGKWASTVHRVVNPPAIDLAASRRQSIGYFMHPDYDAPIRCIPTCLAPGTTALYPEISAGEHIRAKIEASHKTGSVSDRAIALN